MGMKLVPCCRINETVPLVLDFQYKVVGSPTVKL